jgi:hypothetical protein
VRDSVASVAGDAHQRLGDVRSVNQQVDDCWKRLGTLDHGFEELTLAPGNPCLELLDGVGESIMVIRGVGGSAAIDAAAHPSRGHRVRCSPIRRPP